MKLAEKFFFEFLKAAGNTAYQTQVWAVQQALEKVDQERARREGGKDKQKWTAADLKNNEPKWSEKYKGWYIKNPEGGWSRVEKEPPKKG